ncbi:MAG: hypothetical protein LAP21_12435 [Acidobacteriia bacterium]|nr:hypothetical protein [Terriglobia bacterium]
MPKTTKTVKKKAAAKNPVAKKAPAAFGEVFAALCKILAPYEERLNVKTDGSSGYWMESLEPTHKDRPMFFAAVRTGKNYVSFHLMPVYCCPELKSMSPALKKRMQGKACFNFTAVDDVCFKELAVLVKSGYREFREKKWI